METVAITGSGGYIGQHLIAHLENQDRCTRVLGTDIVRPKVISSKLIFSKKDPLSL